jgi:hypothetical protein
MSDPNEQKQSSENQHQDHDMPQPDLAAELRELGDQLQEAARSALNSDPAKTIQRDISVGMNEIVKQIQTALKSVQTNPNMQNLTERGQHAVSQVQESQVVRDFQESLLQGVSKLNEQLGFFIKRMQSETKDTAETASPASQNIPVEEDSDDQETRNPASTDTHKNPPIQNIPIEPDASDAATGETIRLDPETRDE